VLGSALKAELERQSTGGSVRLRLFAGGQRRDLAPAGCRDARPLVYAAAIRRIHLRRGLLRPNGLSEAVRVVWNTEQGGLKRSLKAFWECHDPTQGLAQGMTPASQYRSAIVNRNAASFKPRPMPAPPLTPGANSRRRFLENHHTEIVADRPFFFCRTHHASIYLARPVSRPIAPRAPAECGSRPFPSKCFLRGRQGLEQFTTGRLQHCVLAQALTPESASSRMSNPRFTR